tara:strand:- start:371 stop:1012 length:642 start_codon:yes stop_codon:yes gene_type:complete
MKIKIVLKLVLLFCLINLDNSIKAADYPINYYKGKFYESVKDNFLVATNNMKDPRFKETVIVMFENNKNGAWGLVVNKPISNVFIKDLIDFPKNYKKLNSKIYNKKIPIFWGGPVDKNRIFILHSKEYESESTIKYNKISLSSDFETLLKIAENKGPENNLIIIGISSWGPGQLEGEIEKDDWILSEIKKELIFEIENKEKWKNAFQKGFLKL